VKPVRCDTFSGMYRCGLVAAIILLSCSLGPSQEAPGLSPSDKKGIDDLFADYAQAYIAKDYVKLRECLQAPFIGVSSSGPSIVSTLDGVIAIYHTGRDQLDQRGYADAKPKGAVRISVLARDLVLVNREYSRYKVDGSLLEEVAGFYLVSKSSGKWKIAGTIAQDSVFAGKVY
jgi:hypothetical protein